MKKALILIQKIRESNSMGSHTDMYAAMHGLKWLYLQTKIIRIETKYNTLREKDERAFSTFIVNKTHKRE